MSTTKNFKRYNFVTGAVDGTLAYDFSNPMYFPEEEVYETPQPEAPPRRKVWVREDAVEQAETAVRTKQGFSLLAVIGTLCVMAVLVLVLLAQIQLVGISQNAAQLESRISELQIEHAKLTMEYETVFNLKSVEEYAVGVLGMQEVQDDQIRYLTSVSSADKAVILETTDSRFADLGVDDLLTSLLAYFR